MADIQETKKRVQAAVAGIRAPSGLLDFAAALLADHDRLEKENAALAAWQCVHLDGKTGVTADEHGNKVCAKDARIACLEEDWRDMADERQPLVSRIIDLRIALHQAADWFQQYADGHVAKGDMDKAQRNQLRADACRAALDRDGDPQAIDAQTARIAALEAEVERLKANEIALDRVSPEQFVSPACERGEQVPLPQLCSGQWYFDLVWPCPMLLIGRTADGDLLFDRPGHKQFHGSRFYRTSGVTSAFFKACAALNKEGK